MSEKQKSTENEDVLGAIVSSVDLAKDILELLEKNKDGLKANEIADELDFDVGIKISSSSSVKLCSSTRRSISAFTFCSFPAAT